MSSVCIKCRKFILTSLFVQHSWSSNGTSDSRGDVQPTDGSTQTEADTLTFAEVMKLVQEGKEVPGVNKPDIQPTNQSPAPSQMTRILKPWEKCLQSTICSFCSTTFLNRTEVEVFFIVV
uniref:Peroxisomal membrane protein PEX14-like KPWE domain-containing protein n=1 Tax=Periophthalmus magnuspinnatus TaxID=409849 RepID=A0A3B3ZKX0_9GOBI